MPVEKIKIMLFAQDMGRAVKFYTNVFGFQAGYVSDYWSELLFGDAIIAFHACSEEKLNVSGLSIQVDDAAGTAAAITAAGGTILEQPEQREGEPIKLGRFRDAEGNEVMLTEWVGE